MILIHIKLWKITKLPSISEANNYFLHSIVRRIQYQFKLDNYNYPKHKVLESYNHDLI